MIRFWWHLIWSVLLLFFSAALLLAGIVRSGATPPRLLYSADTHLYETQLGCPLMLSPCSLEGEMQLSDKGVFAGLWSPGSDYIAIYGYDGWMIFPADCFYERKDCRATPLEPPANGIQIAWGPDGTALAYVEVTTTGSILHVLTRRCWDDGAPGVCLRQEALLSAFSALNLAGWSADGERLAFSNIQTRDLLLLESACLAQPATCETLLEVVLPAARAPFPPQWAHLSPDGMRMIFSADVSGRGIDEQLFRYDLTSGATERITFRPAQSTLPQWSPDGRYLAYSGFATPRSSDLSLYVADLWRGLHVRLATRRGQDMVNVRWHLP
jgi:hypothetical protein